jgi:RimJ/RimL family protein N-acetyltransferase
MNTEDRDYLQNEECILGTGRLTLHRPRAADAAGIVRIAHDRTVAENVAGMPFPYGADQAEAWIAGARSGAHVAFVAMAEIDGAATLIGGGGFVAGEGGSLELCAFIGAEHRGRGFGAELAQALVDYGFGTMAATRLQASCRVTNPAARRVVEKCGFQWSGCGLAAYVGSRGAFPVDRFRLDRGIWDSLGAWGRARAARWPHIDISAKAGSEAVMQ